jgi:hypothetical protein
MRKTLLATVAAAAVVGLTTLAAAQAPEGEKGPAAKPQGAQQQPAQQQPKAAPGGAMMHQQGGAEPAEKTPAPRGGTSQGEGTKAQPQGTKAQQEPNSKAPQEQNAKAPEEPGKSGAGADKKSANQAPPSRGGSAQLSQDQRTRIQAIVGKDHAARFTGSVNFNITVGAAVPRSVPVVVLPEDIVEIVPQYEGFDYIIVGDELLIVDPHTLEIVAIIPA